MTTATIDLVGVFATTLPKIVPKVTADIARAHPFTAHCLRNGAFTIEDGGNDIRCDVTLKDSVNTGSVGPYESFAVTPEESVDTARYVGWPKYRFTWTLDQSMITQNRGTGKVIDLAESKQNQALHTFQAAISADLMADGSAFPAKRVKGLETFIEFVAPGSQVNTPGGLSKTTYPNWRNQYAAISSFGANGLDQWGAVYRACSSQGTHPDLILSDDIVYAFYEKELGPKQALMDIELAEYGYENMLFHGTPVVYDRDNLTGTGKTFFLTTTGKKAPAMVKHGISADMFTLPGLNKMAKNMGSGFGFQIHYLRQPDGGIVRIDKPAKPVNQDAIVVNGYQELLLSCSSVKRQGGTSFSGAVQY